MPGSSMAINYYPERSHSPSIVRHPTRDGKKIFVCPSLMLLSQPVPLKLLLALTDLRSELPLLGANAQKMLGGASISPTR